MTESESESTFEKVVTILQNHGFDCSYDGTTPPDWIDDLAELMRQSLEEKSHRQLIKDSIGAGQKDRKKRINAIKKLRENFPKKGTRERIHLSRVWRTRFGSSRDLAKFREWLIELEQVEGELYRTTLKGGNLSARWESAHLMWCVLNQRGEKDLWKASGVIKDLINAAAECEEVDQQQVYEAIKRQDSETP